MNVVSIYEIKFCKKKTKKFSTIKDMEQIPVEKNEIVFAFFYRSV